MKMAQEIGSHVRGLRCLHKPGVAATAEQSALRLQKLGPRSKIENEQAKYSRVAALETLHSRNCCQRRANGDTNDLVVH